MAFNFSAGLSAMGKSVANSAGLYMLESQRAQLENQRIELASRLSAQERQAERRQRLEDERGLINMRHDLEAGDYSPTTKTDAKGRVIFANKKGETMIGPEVRESETRRPISSVAQARLDFKEGLINQKELDAIIAKDTRLPDSARNDDLVEVEDEKGNIVYQPKSGASGKTKRTKRETVQDRILQLSDLKAAGKATQAQLDQLEELKKTSFEERLLGGLLAGGVGVGGGIMDDAEDAPAAPAAKPAPKAADGAADKGTPAAPKDPSQRKIGTVYQTPRGPLRWTGSAWEDV